MKLAAWSVVVLGAVVGALGVARAEGDASLLPLVEGRRWTYDVKRTTQAAVVRTVDEGTATATCGAPETIDGRAFHRVTWRDEERRERSAWVRADASQVELHQASDDRLPLLPARREPGRLEGVRVKVGGSTLSMTELVVRGVERVRTPHGEHEAVRVDATVAAPATRVRTSVWYAAGVGAVKVLEVVEAPATRVERELLLRAVDDGADGPRDATGGPQVEAPEAPQVEAPEASGGPVDGRVRDLVEAAVSGDAAALERLRARAREALRRAQRAAGREVAAGARARADAAEAILDDDVLRSGGLKGGLLVATGDVTLSGGARGSVVFALGDVQVSGGLSGCVVVVLSDLVVSGGVEDSVVITAGDLTVSGGGRGAVVQAEEVSIVGPRRDVVEASDLLELLGR